MGQSVTFRKRVYSRLLGLVSCHVLMNHGSKRRALNMQSNLAFPWYNLLECKQTDLDY